MAFIYYADDEQEIRDVVSSFLISEGHEVTTFENGDLLFKASHELKTPLMAIRGNVDGIRSGYVEPE